MEGSIKLKLGRKIKSTRQKLGYTQEKLSEATGIDYKYIQRIEGRSPPNLKIETIARIAKALKISPSKLLDSD